VSFGVSLVFLPSARQMKIYSGQVSTVTRMDFGPGAYGMVLVDCRDNVLVAECKKNQVMFCTPQGEDLLC